MSLEIKLTSALELERLNTRSSPPSREYLQDTLNREGWPQATAAASGTPRTRLSHRVSLNSHCFVGGMACGEVSSFAASTWIPRCTLCPTSWRRSRLSSVAAFRMGGSEGSAGGGPCQQLPL